ncbi:hypothetical protein D3876_14580 [Sphingomonas cavernae]|uniref:Transferrin-binding protein B C-lobe/N-lobe beta barrel domain-containing protein n=2 Tax=Sphingomonas cavernae TaxID=2320861 RepID=A0A418WMU4_9SPHN|nr:hypothetical protein D3876_14580 [Sphingomonas cavernae]
MTLPGVPRSYLDVLATETGDDFSGSILQPAGGIVVYMLRPGIQNRVLALSSTSVGYFGWSPIGASARDRIQGVFGYGVPSTTADIPTSGVASFSLYGYAAARPAGVNSDPIFYQFLGSAEFDLSLRAVRGSFATGNLTGYPSRGSLAERFEFSQASFKSDGTFTGTLTVPGMTGAGEYEGSFTGPGAGELMLRWKAPYRDPATGRTDMIYGVLVGKKN